MTMPDAAALACDPNSICELMASWMVAKIGVKETSRNSGPEIDEWLRLVNLSAGNEWCAATVYAAAYYASRDLGIVNPCPRTASALRLWTLSDPVCHASTPARGRIYIMDHGGGKGHAGVIEFVNPDGTVCAISGNTNAAGSRMGDCVGRHIGDLEEIHHADLVGFVDLSRAPTRPLDLVA